MKYKFENIQQQGRVTLVEGNQTVIVIDGEADLDPKNHADIIRIYGGQPVKAKPAKKDK